MKRAASGPLFFWPFGAAGFPQTLTHSGNVCRAAPAKIDVVGCASARLAMPGHFTEYPNVKIPLFSPAQGS
jgi:hypothetical protein